MQNNKSALYLGDGKKGRKKGDWIFFCWYGIVSYYWFLNTFVLDIISSVMFIYCVYS